MAIPNSVLRGNGLGIRKPFTVGGTTCGTAIALGWMKPWLQSVSKKTLMRHASITTTMNIYGRAIPEARREAHGNVVTMLKEAVGTL